MRATKEDILTYLKEIKPQLKEDGIISLGLFGSYAKGTQGVYSDIDVAIEKDKDYLKTKNAYSYFEQVSKIQNLIQKKFGRKSDIFEMSAPLNKINAR
jgi:predicted nucleotidyltransferase